MRGGRSTHIRTSALLIFRSSLLFAVLVIVARSGGIAAEQRRSLVLKADSPGGNPFRLKHDHSSEELWDAFMLVKQANAGDAVAEHELGLHYLIGKDFSADSQKAVHWI